MGGTLRSRTPKMLLIYIFLSIILLLVALAGGLWVTYNIFADQGTFRTSASWQDFLYTFVYAGPGIAMFYLVLFELIGAVFLIPTFVADARAHADRSLIIAANVALGWTIFGWIVALVWALTPTSGLRAMLGMIRERAAPEVVRLRASTVELGKNVQRHPLVGEAERWVDKALGGKLRRYTPPNEGTTSLVDEWSAGPCVDDAPRLGGVGLRRGGTFVESLEVGLNLLGAADEMGEVGAAQGEMGTADVPQQAETDHFGEQGIKGVVAEIGREALRPAAGGEFAQFVRTEAAASMCGLSRLSSAITRARRR
jgi:hypothetical protein